ncbi:hypothetical protein D9M72_637740 [compost metagenome]
MSTLQLSPPVSVVSAVLALATIRPTELKHTAAGPVIVTPAPTSVRTPEETNALLSSAIEGRARAVQWLPSAFAVNAGLAAVDLLSVSAKTTWRLRRSDSLCASRRPF